jgi:hypothetical protein
MKRNRHDQVVENVVPSFVPGTCAPADGPGPVIVTWLPVS